MSDSGMDLGALRKVAEAASMGTWQAAFRPGRHGYNVYGEDAVYIVCTAGEERNAKYIAEFDPDTVLALIKEIDRCHDRLEIDHVWHATSGGDVLRRVPYSERAKLPDGTECRDETIKLQDVRIKALEAKIRVSRDMAFEEAAQEVEDWCGTYAASIADPLAAAIRSLKEESK